MPCRSARFGEQFPEIDMLHAGLPLEQAPLISVAKPGGLRR